MEEQTNERTNERTIKRLNEETNEQTKKRTNEEAYEQTKKRTAVRRNERANGQTNDWTKERTNTQTNRRTEGQTNWTNAKEGTNERPNKRMTILGDPGAVNGGGKRQSGREKNSGEEKSTTLLGLRGWRMTKRTNNRTDEQTNKRTNNEKNGLERTAVNMLGRLSGLTNNWISWMKLTRLTFNHLKTLIIQLVTFSFHWNYFILFNSYAWRCCNFT